MRRPRIHWFRAAVLVVAACAISGCSRGVASAAAIDVCAVARDAVAAAQFGSRKPVGQNQLPAVGSCVFTADTDARQPPQVSVVVFTNASVAASGMSIDKMVTAELGEDRASWGDPGSNDLPGLAKDAYVFGRSPGFADRIVLAGNGVELEISLTGDPINRADAATMTRAIWKNLLAYHPAH